MVVSFGRETRFSTPKRDTKSVLKPTADATPAEAARGMALLTKLAG
jgi:hypothetical protein